MGSIIVPEDLTRSGAAERRAIVRAITAQALGTLRRSDPARILKGTWPRDSVAALALAAINRAAQTPTSTGDVPALAVESVRALPLLAPRSAAFQLFTAAGITIDLGRAATVKVPNVAAVPAARFVAEG